MLGSLSSVFSFIKKKKEDAKRKKKGTPKLEDFLMYTLRESGETFYCLAEPEGEFVAVLGISPPHKPCNWAVQVKHAAVVSKYRGKGVGSYLYKLAGVLATTEFGKVSITSDHTESSTTLAKDVWDNMVPLNFDKVKLKGGNEKFDYTGEDTPDFPNDDCTLPSQGRPATDYAWKLKPSEASYVKSIYMKQVSNVEDLGAELSNDEIYEKMSKMWRATYNQDVGLAESTYRRWGKLANILEE